MQTTNSLEFIHFQATELRKSKNCHDIKFLIRKFIRCIIKWFRIHYTVYTIIVHIPSRPIFHHFKIHY